MNSYTWHTSTGWPAKTDCADFGCRLEDLREGMVDWDGWGESVKDSVLSVTLGHHNYFGSYFNMIHYMNNIEYKKNLSIQLYFSIYS